MPRRLRGGLADSRRGIAAGRPPGRPRSVLARRRRRRPWEAGSLEASESDTEMPAAGLAGFSCIPCSSNSRTAAYRRESDVPLYGNVRIERSARVAAVWPLFSHWAYGKGGTGRRRHPPLFDAGKPDFLRHFPVSATRQVESERQTLVH